MGSQKLKRILSIALSLSMVLSTNMTGFAADTSADTTEHVHDNWRLVEVLADQNCVTPGVGYYKCNEDGCNEEKWDDIPPLHHSYEEEALDYDEFEHGEGKDMTTVPATCKDAGSITYHCLREGCEEDDKVVTIPKTTDHDYLKDGEDGQKVENIVNIPPTCTEVGKDVIKCVVCGEVKPGSETPDGTELAEHDFQPKVVQEADCEQVELSQNTCTVCGATDGDPYKTGEMADHKYNEGTVNPEPTCTEKGEKVQTCSVCGDVKRTEIDALGHDEQYNTTEATCTEDGTKITTCSRCDYKKTETLTATGHTEVPIGEYKPATCGEAGMTAGKKCSVCGDILEAQTEIPISAAGHVVEDMDHPKLIFKAATCTENGVGKYTCDVCKKDVFLSIPAGHAYDQGTVEKQATCNADGSMLYRCTRADCPVKGGATKKEAITDRPAHNYQQSTIPPTCTEGTKTGEVCTVCGNVKDGYTTEGEGTGHSYVEKLNEPASCGVAGRLVEVCSKCNDVKTTTLDAKEHDAGTDKTLPADCQHNTLSYKECTICHKEIPDTRVDEYEAAEEAGATEEVLAPLRKKDHDYKVAVVYQEPGCTSTGIAKVECSMCGDTKNQILDPEHKDDNGTITTPAKCEETGIKTYTCSVCQRTRTETIEATGHKWEVLGNEEFETEYPAYVKGTQPVGCKDGEKYYECPDCTEKSEPVVLPGDGQHDFADGAKTELPATCTSNKKTGLFCGNCDMPSPDVEVKEIGDTKLPHTYDTDSLDKNDPNQYVLIKEVSCTEDGQEKVTCTQCNNTETRTIKSEGHTLKSTGFEEANCQQNAQALSECTVCKETFKEDLGELGEGYVKTGHNYADGELKQVVLEASCTSNGMEVRQCTGCTRTSSVIIPAAHKFGESVQTKAPKCEEAGEMTKTCSVCGAVEKEDIDPVGHLYDTMTEEEFEEAYGASGTVEAGYVEETTPPDGCKPGVKTFTCPACKDHTKKVEIPGDSTATHDFSKTELEATCTEPKLVGSFCSKCDAVNPNAPEPAEVGEPLGHTYEREGFDETNGVVKEEATCEDKGKILYTCTDCDETKLADIPAKGHTEVGEMIPANCMEVGKAVTKCEVCKKVLKTEDLTDIAPINPNAHVRPTDDTAIDTEDATCTTDGHVIYTCTKCKKEVNETIPSGHKWDNGTLNEDRNAIVRTCSVCGDTEIVYVLSGYVECSECKKIVKPEVVPQKDATCSEAGYTEGTKCPTEGCENVFEGMISIPTIDHTPEWSITKQPTCKETGTKIQKCAVCERVLDDQPTSIPATGEHQYTVTMIKGESCTDDYKYITKCSVCGDPDPANPGEQILEGSAPGHKFVDGECTECQIAEKVLTITPEAYTESGKAKVKFTAIAVINNSNWKVVERGMLYSTNASFGGADNLVLTEAYQPAALVTALKISSASSRGTAKTFALTDASKNRTLYGRAYAVVEINGEKQVLYSNVIATSYDELMEESVE